MRGSCPGKNKANLEGVSSWKLQVSSRRAQASCPLTSNFTLPQETPYGVTASGTRVQNKANFHRSEIALTTDRSGTYETNMEIRAREEQSQLGPASWRGRLMPGGSASAGGNARAFRRCATKFRGAAGLILLLRAQRSNLALSALRLPRRCTSRDDMPQAAGRARCGCRASPQNVVAHFRRRTGQDLRGREPEQAVEWVRSLGVARRVAGLRENPPNLIRIHAGRAEPNGGRFNRGQACVGKRWTSRFRYRRQNRFRQERFFYWPRGVCSDEHTTDECPSRDCHRSHAPGRRE